MEAPLRVLVAVAPPLRRVVEHLLAGAAFRIVGRPRLLAALVRDAPRRRPDLILLDGRLLGRASAPALARLRRDNPRARLVAIHARHAGREPWAHARVAEDALVRKLLATLRRVLGARRRGPARGL